MPAWLNSSAVNRRTAAPAPAIEVCAIDLSG
jgi:hypothetical protein